MKVTVEHLTKIYKGNKVVNDLDFTVVENEVFALLGSNGAGKSTTIKILIGLVKKDGGNIAIASGSKIGYSPETPYFPPFLTAAETLEYYAGLQKIPRTERSGAVESLLARVGLEKNQTKVKAYSKGMLQRLALAQALLGNPDLLVLDEPCAGLDAMGRIKMLEIIKELKKQGKTVILNSHILSDIEKVCDRGIIMGKGRKLKDWRKEELGGDVTLETIFVSAIQNDGTQSHQSGPAPECSQLTKKIWILGGRRHGYVHNEKCAAGKNPKA